MNVTAVIDTYPGELAQTRQDAEKLAERAVGLPYKYERGGSTDGRITRAWVEGDDQSGKVIAEIAIKTGQGA